MTRPAFRRLCLALAAVAATLIVSPAHAAPAAGDDSDLPATLRRGYVGPVIGPADDTAYARGALGLVRTSFGRASLFVAWRVMNLPVGAVARESHERRGHWVYGGANPRSGDDELEAWLGARRAVVPQAPAVAPDYFRTGKLKVSAEVTFDVTTGQCGPDAYAFATRTLQGLVADAALTATDRRVWVAGQDAVFARCSWTPGAQPAPALPAPVSTRAPDKMKALQAYQHASALFYGDDHAAALQAFDTIAAVPDHPMRPWAVLGATRSIVRDTVRDAEWDAAVQDAWTRRGLRGDAFRAAVAEPSARRNARVDAAVKEVDRRVIAAAADASLAPVHGAMRYTVRRAVLQLMPAVPMRQAMRALDRPEANPYEMGVLDLFQELYPRVSPDRPEGKLADAMRQHAWFDFIVTVQGCADAPQAADDAVCAAEHAHAQARWQETKHHAWLLATLMTARRPTAADVPAAYAARTVAADRPEWASLQFHAARVLRAQGHGADARAALDALAAARLPKRDLVLVDAERRAL